MKPSQLTENQAVAIRNGQSTICFHRYYGELSMSAMDKDADVFGGEGLLITTNEEFADQVYLEYLTKIENRDAGKFPAVCDDVKIIHYSSDGQIIKVR